MDFSAESICSQGFGAGNVISFQKQEYKQKMLEENF